MPTKEKFYEYVRNATSGKKSRKPGIKENVFDRPGEVFHCFDRQYCRKMTYKFYLPLKSGKFKPEHVLKIQVLSRVGFLYYEVN